jgi:hypothetical protein
MHPAMCPFTLCTYLHVKVKLSLDLTMYRAMNTYPIINQAPHHEEIKLHAFLNSVLDGGEWSALSLDRFTTVERDPITHLIGGWMGPRSGLETVAKRNIPSP